MYLCCLVHSTQSGIKCNPYGEIITGEFLSDNISNFNRGFWYLPPNLVKWDEWYTSNTISCQLRYIFNQKNLVVLDSTNTWRYSYYTLTFFGAINCKIQMIFPFIHFQIQIKEEKWKTKRRNMFWFFYWVLISYHSDHKATMCSPFSPMLKNSVFPSTLQA